MCRPGIVRGTPWPGDGSAAHGPPRWGRGGCDSQDIVVALGGNAWARSRNVTVYDQFRHTRESLVSVIELAKQGYRIVWFTETGPKSETSSEERARRMSCLSFHSVCWWPRPRAGSAT